MRPRPESLVDSDLEAWADEALAEIAELNDKLRSERATITQAHRALIDLTTGQRSETLLDAVNSVERKINQLSIRVEEDVRSERAICSKMVSEVIAALGYPPLCGMSPIEAATKLREERDDLRRQLATRWPDPRLVRQTKAVVKAVERWMDCESWSEEEERAELEMTLAYEQLRAAQRVIEEEDKP